MTFLCTKGKDDDEICEKLCVRLFPIDSRRRRRRKRMATTGNDDDNNNNASSEEEERGHRPSSGGQMTMAFSTKKQSKTSTVTITGTYVCVFSNSFLLSRTRLSLSILVYTCGRERRLSITVRVSTPPNAHFSLFLSRSFFSSSQGNTNTSSPGILCSKASGTANRSRRIDLPSEATNGSSCFTQTGNKRKSASAATSAAGRSVLRAIRGVDWRRTEVTRRYSVVDWESGESVSSILRWWTRAGTDEISRKEAKRTRRGEDFVREARSERQELSRLQEVCQKKCFGSAK